MEPIHIISLGAGVQSSCMALMAAKGEIGPMPTAAIFADTQAEPKEVYAWLDWLEKQLPFPVLRITAGSLTEISLTPATSKKSNLKYMRWLIPGFTLNSAGQKGMMFRQCTDKAKITPMRKAVSDMLKKSGATKCILWMGISTDEIMRAKDSQRRNTVHRFPLIDLEFSRKDCLDWMRGGNLPEPPRSACVYCPYHSDREWRRLKTDLPDDFAAAVDYELKLQSAFANCGRLISTPYLHSSRKPLSEVDFSTEEERGQLNMFNNECEGMCGV